MANTLTKVKSTQGEWKNPQGWFTEVWTVEATIDDQDAISATDTAVFSTISVQGVALGDMVIGCVVDNDLSDGTDQVVVQGLVTAADTVSLYVTADAGAYAVDDLNDATVKMMIGRPAW